MEEWSVDIECVVDPPVVIDDGMIDDILERLHDRGVALAYDQDGGHHLSLQFNVEAKDSLAAFQEALRLVLGLPYLLRPVGGRIQTVEDLKRELDEPTIPELVGVAEVAAELRISKTRVNELRGSPAFPEPVAHLKSGPVWTRPSLTRFLEGWERRPGRPRKAAATKRPAATPARKRRIVKAT